LVQFGSPRDIYEDPISIYAAGRLGSPKMNVLPASLFPGAPNKAASIGLRPEHIQIGTGVKAEVVRVERLGDQTRLHLKTNNVEIMTLTEPHTILKRGDVVAISPKEPLYFDTNGNRLK
jgi:multiple sugar transport system ATP-binding protein